ncbi:hypothetical protein [Marinicauda sp. Alg238-R41]|uniref:hypothetical protein n=1 Tax=Marinicauda sp. Alg238-R41 TaxID=2993447 RepID=UPI0022E51578|nr:hypothetical protein [Marinicauda sp. Alg238-R41]
MPLYTVTNNRPAGTWSIITAHGTKTVAAGQSGEFEMSEAEAKNGEADRVVIKAKGDALPAGEKGAEVFDPRQDEAPADDLTALRTEYEAKVGKKPFMGWKADMLRQKIAEAE